MVASLSDDEKTALALFTWHVGAHRNEYPFLPVVDPAGFKRLDDATCSAVWEIHGKKRSWSDESIQTEEDFRSVISTAEVCTTKFRRLLSSLTGIVGQNTAKLADHPGPSRARRQGP